jgi:CBS domain-containing protein
MTRVADVMTRSVRTVAPSDTVALAARLMEEMDVGSLPVCEGDELVGIVTDRDIVVRAVAHDRPINQTQLAEVMTRDPQACFEEQAVEEVIDSMRESQVRRLPVVDQQRHVVGVVSLGDLAVKHDEAEAGDALEAISEPAEPAAPASKAGSGSGLQGKAPGAKK